LTQKINRSSGYIAKLKLLRFRRKPDWKRGTYFTAQSLQADQKGSDTRRATNRRAEAYSGVRWSETVERNEVDELFSTAWQKRLEDYANA
jgi:hypothetical protein